MRRQSVDHGLIAEVVAPRLWEHPKTIDGGYTANDAAERRYAVERSKRAGDFAAEMGCNLMLLRLTREGTYVREPKDIDKSTGYLLEAVYATPEYDKILRIAVEPKPSEPMDLAYIPTMGHAVALGYRSNEPACVGVLMESAHSILAGLDPADEVGFATAAGKLWSVHLNDQNGPKYDRDRSFASVDLPRAFNQARVLDENRF